MQKKTFIRVAALLLLIAGSFPLAGSAKAAEIRNMEGDEKSIEVEDTINDDLYVGAEEKVTVKQDVNGDLFVGGGVVEVQGMVLGDAFCAGGQITLEDNVNGSVFIAGGQVEIKGNVSGNLTAAGGMIKISGNVTKDVLMAGGQLTIEGNINDDIRATGGMLTVQGDVGDDVMTSCGALVLDGKVGGDIYASGGSVDINSASVGGDIVFYGKESDLDVDEATKVSGTTSIEEPPIVPVDTTKNIKPFFGGVSVFSGMFGFFSKLLFTAFRIVGYVLLGLLIIKFAPVKVDKVLAKMKTPTEAASSLGIGCVAIPLGIFLGLILLLPFFWPILTLLGALFAIAKVLAIPIVGIIVGRMITSLFKSKNMYTLPLIIGVAILELLTLIPCIGTLLAVLVFLIGLGAMLRMWYFKYIEATKATSKKRKK